MEGWTLSVGMAQQSWVDLLSALLTPTIAVAVMLIAYLQWRTNYIRLKHELFDRRYEIFNVAVKFVLETSVDEIYRGRELINFLEGTSGAAFIFNSELGDLLIAIFEHAQKLGGANEEIVSERDAEKLRSLEASRDEHFNFIKSQEKAIRSIAEPYLSLSWRFLPDRIWNK